jgi:uncharacterized membrane protein YbaN (DUF454 family)
MQIRKTLLIICGFLFVGLGTLGIFVPVLPTTVFFLLAAACFARSSPRFYHWLLHNRWFGSYIRNYREGRGLPMRHKVVTVGLLWLTIGGTILVVSQWWLRLLLAGVVVGVTWHVLSIKTYHPALSSPEGETEGV